VEDIDAVDPLSSGKPPVKDYNEDAKSTITYMTEASSVLQPLSHASMVSSKMEL